ncbi:hypothetical protein CTM93_12995 [Photobacterium phosphoreum]|uniref:hypothetical protein n=1 Tax=Photobacterium phosphoreum TaxID=659 RepID=UPI000D185E93|nr:hypothetical protein [Photobacterium phosphoreum]PSU82505.1 hypothetical protein CTM93_12995 [Photobacterium phosphoreum]
MKQELRNTYIARITKEMSEVLTGATFERFGYIITEQVFNDYELNHRGTNLAGSPVGYVVDTFSSCGRVVAEYSTDAGYFTDFTKIENDKTHALEHYPESLKTLFLLSNRECPPSSQRRVTELVLSTEATDSIDLIIWDARDTAEYIVNELLFDEAVTERLAYFLPSIQTIRNESALNLTIPKVEDSYQPRVDIESKLSHRLLTGHSCVVVGFGGAGKSNLAVAIVNSIKEEFDLSLWLDASEVQSLDDLGHYDVYRNGHQVNILGLLKSKKILLVLDNLLAPVSQRHLEDICSNESVILATRRNVVDESDWSLPLLSSEVAKSILEYDTETPCPETTFKKVYDTVGGYPLIYGLMNANIRSDDYEWEDIDNDCEAILEYEDHKNQKLTERLLGHLQGSLATQLSFLKACETKIIDLDFAKASIKPIGIKKLIKSTIVTKSNIGFLKVHDVIFEALTNIDAGQIDLSSLLKDYLENTEAERWSAFLRVSYRHQKLIYNLYRSTGDSIYLYSHLIASVPSVLNKNEIETPSDQFEKINSHFPDIDRIKVSALIEWIENLYLLDKEMSIDFAKAELEKSLPIFLRLKELVTEKAELLKLVMHHYAKCLLRLDKEAEAETEFATLNQKYTSMYEVKLQLARIYSRSDRPEEAKLFIEEILDAWKAESGPSISVALASFELVSRTSMRKYKKELNEKYSDLVAMIIKESMAFGYDHSYRAFSLFAGDWAFNHPEKFLDIFAYLPLPPLSLISDDYTKNSVGDLYREAGKIHLRMNDPKAEIYLSLALDFYESVIHRTPFHVRRIAETHCLLRQYEISQKICLELLDNNDKDPFVYFWLSKSLFGLNHLQEALERIDIGIEKLRGYPDSFHASFLEVKSDIHLALGLDDYIELLEAGARKSDSPKYISQLEEKIFSLVNQKQETFN